MSYLGSFEADISKFNEMYAMKKVTSLSEKVARLAAFEDILKEECNEINDVVPRTDETINLDQVMVTNFSDLLGDICIFCASEAVRWNIPLPEVLRIIMQSNFSKLQADGTALFDERGKLQKGPGYWKPEPQIAALLQRMTVAINVESKLPEASRPGNDGETAVITEQVVGAAASGASYGDTTDDSFTNPTEEPAQNPQQ